MPCESYQVFQFGWLDQVLFLTLGEFWALFYENLSNYDQVEEILFYS